MANDALFNWIGSLVGIPFWRQLIWAVGLIILFRIVHNKKLYIPFIRKTVRQYIVFSVIIAVFAILTILIEGFNIVRIIMSFFEYFFGIIFIVFPLVCVRSGWSLSRINRFFIFLGCFIATGLYLDFSLGGAITSFFRIVTMQSIDEGQFMYYGRFSFMSTTDSIFTLMLSLSLFCCFREFSNTSNNLSKIILLGLSVFIVFGSVFCGARQTLAALLIVEMMGILFVIWGNRKGMVAICGVCLLLTMALPIAQNVLSSNKGFESRYTKEALQEDERGATWREGFVRCFIDTNLKRIVMGDGVGYTLGTYAAPDEAKSRHYENTFLARIIDVGVPMTIALLFTPVFYIIKWRRKKKVNILYFGVILSYIFIGLISPNAASNQSQMSMFILLALFFIDNDRENYYKRSPLND